MRRNEEFRIEVVNSGGLLYKVLTVWFGIKQV
jgi:hypothetical protein